MPVVDLVYHPAVVRAYKKRAEGANSTECLKAYIGDLLKLCAWFADSKPPAASGWSGHRGHARKLKGEMDDALAEQAADMIKGSFWRKQLCGWGQFVSCATAIVKMCEDHTALSFAKQVLVDCTNQNNRMQEAMFRRREKVPEDADAPPVTLDNTERRDISAEAKWMRICEWLEEAEPNLGVRSVLEMLYRHVKNEKTPAATFASMQKQLLMPPGYARTSEKLEAERLQRAKEAEEDDDFDLGSPDEEPSADEAAAEAHAAAAAAVSAAVSTAVAAAAREEAPSAATTEKEESSAATTEKEVSSADGGTPPAALHSPVHSGVDSDAESDATDAEEGVAEALAAASRGRKRPLEEGLLEEDPAKAARDKIYKERHDQIKQLTPLRNNITQLIETYAKMLHDIVPDMDLATCAEWAHLDVCPAVADRPPVGA